MAKGSAGDGEMSGARERGYVAGMRAALPFGFTVALVGVSFSVLVRSLGWGASLL